MGDITPLLLSAVIDSIDSIFIFGGHNDVGGSSSAYRESRSSDGGGGLGVVPIVGVAVLAVVTVGLLVGLDRPQKLKAVAPAALMVAVIALPLVLWTASSGGDDRSLIVERYTTPKGATELIVSVADEDVNTLGTTNGKRTVRLECRGRDGQVVLGAAKAWPFANEPGFDYPHRHQRATLEQLQRADRCRLGGTTVSLEADVEGALRPGSR